MKSFFKTAALILSVILLSLSFSSCGTVENDLYNIEKNSEGPDSASKETEAETTNKSFVDFDNPDIDEYVEDLAAVYGKKGESFTWCGNEGQAPWNEEETGELQNDALYFRQRQLEETFGVAWDNYRPAAIGDSENQPVYDHVMQDVLSGNGAFDVCYGTTIAIAQPLFLHDALADLSGYNYIDLDREWWTPNIMDIYGIESAIYFLNGAIVTSNYEDTWCIAFNKKIAGDYGISGLYDLVYNNEWTFDKMFEVASVIPPNENRSGVYRFGNASGDATMYAHGYTLAKFNEDGTPYVEESLSAELYDLADKFSVIYGDETISAICKGGSIGHYEWVINKFGYEGFNEMFSEDEFLFYFLTTGDAAWLRTYDVEFGILPMPKGSVQQEDYISHTYMWGASNVFVPRSAKNTELSDVMTEAMAALGYKYIKPAYYDMILKTRATYDYESKEMIDIVFRTKTYDLIDFLAVGGSINTESDFVRLVRYAMQESTDGIASRYWLQAKIVNRNIDTILNMVREDMEG